VGGTIYYVMLWADMLGDVPAPGIDPRQALLPYEWLSVFRFEWIGAFQDSLKYMPLVVPFALATVVGGIDCTESAAAAGDEFDTRQVIGVEALATLVAAVCGGVIQTTPYIGHPAYKAMGGRAAYTLATALFVGAAGVFGYFGYLYVLIPKAAVFPILVFIGLEITAQSFQATPKKHYAAVALACVPALAALAVVFIDKIFGDPIMFANKININTLSESLRDELLTVRVLANGFILTSLLWASALAALIDRRLCLAAVYFLVSSAFSLFGVIHSPLKGSPLFFPWKLEADLQHVPYHYAAGYLCVAFGLLLWQWGQPTPVNEELEQ
jgi:AGZA family xanthine/uracil permease-like MFS transporter